MNSGLAFSEVYDDFESDVVTMLLHTTDSGAFAARNPSRQSPARFGTTAPAQPISSPGVCDWAWPMTSSTVVFPTISSSSRSACSAPCWERTHPEPLWAPHLPTRRPGTGRVSAFSLQDGRWGDRRLLPEGWVEHATTPTPGSDQKYGAHWGLNRGGRHPDIPRDAFNARGFGGQLVLVVPSRDMVIVMLGQTPGEGFDVNAFAAKVREAF